MTTESPADSQPLPTGGESAGSVLAGGSAASGSPAGDTVAGQGAAPAVSGAGAVGGVEGNFFELTDPDVRLMLLVKQGSAAAFEQLVRLYQDRVLAILRHLIPHRQQSEDLAQDVFLRMYRARESYVPNAKFSTWVFTITQNVARNAIRQMSRRREQQLGGAATDSGPAPTMEQLAKDASGLQPARQLEQLEMSQVVRMALETLSERQRMAVLLAKFENMSYQEIADTMGLTVPAIKSLLSRARNNLRDALQPYLDQGGLPRGSGESAGGAEAAGDR